MTKIYFVRHGETAWNIEARYQGITDIPLSEKGVAQSKLLSERFKKINLDKIYASPLSRAIATANAVAKPKNMNIELLDEFIEINFGEWEGKTIHELQSEYGETYMDFFNNPYATPFPGDGSFDIVEKRVCNGIKKIILENDDKNIMVVSHGGVLRLMVINILGLPKTMYKKLWLDNTSVTVIDSVNGELFLRTLNDKAHLENI
ncbi:MAG: histidine phosphatase family protein [Lachnospiraceae bacterium]|nr:histidine phosphatase family protein [Lachnospiraceae bacterium]